MLTRHSRLYNDEFLQKPDQPMTARLATPADAAAIAAIYNEGIEGRIATFGLPVAEAAQSEGRPGHRL